MKLTEKQEEARLIALDRYRNNEKVTTIAGYAGTGKTFLVRKIIESLGLRRAEYKIAAYTGKASLVLRQRGFSAITIHKLLYNALPQEDGTFIFEKKGKRDESFRNCKLIVLDEVSMIPRNMMEDIAKLGIHVIGLGDPGQLPPIGDTDNGLLKSPHIFLDEIMRQSDGNSIPHFTSLIRNSRGSKIDWTNDEFVKIIEFEDFVPEMMDWADQMICSRNDTREGLNNFYRKHKGYTDLLPEVGEKIIFTKNDWDTSNPDGEAVVNGMMGIVSDMKESASSMIIDLDVDFTPSPFSGLRVETDNFLGIKEKKRKFYPRHGGPRFQKADFGYAITTHKSQGSEYDNVILFEESLDLGTLIALLYTGATRAKRRLILVKNPHGSKFNITSV